MNNCVKLAMLEVCDTIMRHAKERFSFTKHLISATLLQGDLFPQHSRKFPDSVLETTVDACPMLDKARLKTELSLIYEHVDFQGCGGAPALLQVLLGNNLQDTFSQTLSLPGRWTLVADPHYPPTPLLPLRWTLVADPHNLPPPLSSVLYIVLCKPMVGPGLQCAYCI
ncbi:unnamed protein product [Arctogadus glacialis]